jgi:hypothetical protein
MVIGFTAFLQDIDVITWVHYVPEEINAIIG